MPPETIALTSFAVVISSMVISQLASKVSIIPEWDTFYTEIIIPKGLPLAMYESQRNVNFVNRTPWELCLVNKLKEKSYIS